MANQWLERELENWVVANPHEIGRGMHEVSVNKQPFVYLGRQIKCTVGIVDLLFHSSRTLFVVELKAVRATAKDLGQVLRYTNYIEDYLFDFVSHPYPSQLNAMVYEFAKSMVEISPVLIAPDFDHMAAALPYVHTLQATKTDDGFEIEPVWKHDPAFGDSELRQALAPFAKLIQRETLEKARFDAERDARLSIERRLSDTN